MKDAAVWLLLAAAALSSCSRGYDVLATIRPTWVELGSSASQGGISNTGTVNCVYPAVDSQGRALVTWADDEPQQFQSSSSFSSISRCWHTAAMDSLYSLAVP